MTEERGDNSKSGKEYEAGNIQCKKGDEGGGKKGGDGVIRLHFKLNITLHVAIHLCCTVLIIFPFKHSLTHGAFYLGLLLEGWTEI